MVLFMRYLPSAKPGPWFLFPTQVVLIALVVGLGILGLVRVLPIMVPMPSQWDFRAYYVAAAVLNSETPILYKAEAVEGLNSAEELQAYNAYIYPPIWAVLLRPVAHLPYDLAKALWYLLNWFFLLGSLTLLGRMWDPPLGMVQVLGLSIAALMLPAVYGTFMWGQINFLLLAGLTGALYVSSLPSRQGSLFTNVLAGTLLGLLVAIKLFPVFVMLCYLPRRRAVVAFAVLTAMILTAIGVIAGGGLSNTIHYFAMVLPSLSNRLTVPTLNNQSVCAFYLRLLPFAQLELGFTSLSIERMADLTAVTILALTAVVLFTKRANWHAAESAKIDVGFAMTIVCALLVTPVVWDHYYVLLLIPLFSLAQQYLRRRHEGLGLLLLMSLLLLLLQRYLSLISKLMASVWLHSLGFYAVVLLWLLLAWCLKEQT